MTNASLSRVVNQFSLQDGFQGNNVINDAFFPVCFWACIGAKVHGNTNGTVIISRPASAKKTTKK